tara:strand:- start:4507 stop:5244 length:738 start_codon:yes stop_codon:yes gene_type:complete
MSTDPILQKQLANADALQGMIEKANDSIYCGKGTQCYFQKNSDELESIFKAKQQNIKTAKNQLDEARKNYYTFAYGESGYINEETERLNKVSDKIIDSLTESHKKNVDSVDSLINELDVSLKYKIQLLTNLKGLYKEDSHLTQEIEDEIAALKTSDRKVYYEEEEINNADLWVAVLKGLYWLVFAVFIGLFLIKSLWKNKIYILFLILLVAWPFISDFIVVKILQLIKKIINALPKDVYINSSSM